MFGVPPLWSVGSPRTSGTASPWPCGAPVETPDALILIDNGAGNKEDAKFVDIYGIENAGTPTRLEDAIRDAGFSPDDVDYVIDTHLHFDHAGGNTFRDGEGRVRISFPRARYVVQRGEWEWAHLRNERIRASYLPDNFDPWGGRALRLRRGRAEVCRGPAGADAGSRRTISRSSSRQGTRHFLADLVRRRRTCRSRGS